MKKLFLGVIALTIIFILGCNGITTTTDIDDTNSISTTTEVNISTTNSSTTENNSEITTSNIITTSPTTTTSTTTELTTTTTELTTTTEVTQETFVVSFNSMGGTPVDSITVNKGDTILSPEVYLEGYSLEGWYISYNDGLTYDEKWSFATFIVTHNLTLYAKWEINQYTLLILDYDHSVIYAEEYDYQEDLSSLAIPDPSREGYTFIYWDNEIPLSMPAQNLTIHAVYLINQYDIEYSIVEYNSLTNIPLLPGEYIEQISLGDSSAGIITSFSRIFVWGGNSYGQLGDGTLISKASPIEITSQFDLSINETITDISLGYSHSAAISSTGRLFMWGANGAGQLGDGTTTSSLTPIEITSQFTFSLDEIIIQISMGHGHSAVLTSEGKVFTWGYNSNGQLGDGTFQDRLTPTDITSRFSLEASETIIQVCLGEYYSSAITSSSRVFTWGSNQYGKLGDGTTTAKTTPTDISTQFDFEAGEVAKRIFLSNIYSGLLTSSGRVFMWGDNLSGQLGDGTLTTQYNPVDITSHFSFENDEIVTDIRTGYGHTVAITSLNRIFAWGLNSSGQLGDSTLENKATPVDITPFTNFQEGEDAVILATGGRFTAVLTSFDRFFIWGFNYSGQIGDGTAWISTPQNITPNFPLEKFEQITDIVLEHYHSAAISSTGRLFMWGNNLSGQLGDGTNENKVNPTDITDQFDLAEGETIVQVSLGIYHSVAMTSLGRVFTWGSNQYGKLGDGTTENKSTPTDITSFFSLPKYESIIQISACNQYSSALTSLGRIFTWGYNYYGQLGDGTTTNSSLPIDITSNFSLLSGETIVQISMGNHHSGALSSEGRVFTWGLNNHGQLGDGTTTNSSLPINITSNFSLSSGETIVQISMGGGHSGVLTSEGKVFTWGWNDNGQLGDDSIISSLNPIDITSQIKLQDEEEIIEISLGKLNSSVRSSLGRVFIWGHNLYGEIGNGTQDNQLTPNNVTLMFELTTGDTIEHTSLGYYYSAAVSSNGNVYTWGYNSHGQLGNGTFPYRTTPTELTVNEIEVVYIELNDYESIINEYIPTREGYIFSGWYLDRRMTVEYAFTTMPATDLVLYGYWYLP